MKSPPACLKHNNKLIIFTDLDGTLLNHADYSLADARPALDLLQSKGIPLIICTSKTRSEVQLLTNQYDFKDPFIVENGGAIFFPRAGYDFPITEALDWEEYRAVVRGLPYVRIRSFVEQARPQFPVTGFGDLTAEEIARITGLDLDQAICAKQREFSEPLIIPAGTDLNGFMALAGKAGIKLTKGGRFWHLTGMRHDKGAAVKLTQTILERQALIKTATIGLGDSPNDIPMLANVDQPILIPHPDGIHEDIRLPRLIKATLPGSAGWNMVILELLNTLKD